MDTNWTLPYFIIDLVWYLLFKTVLGWFKDMFYKVFAEGQETISADSNTNDSRVKIITLNESGDLVTTRIVLRKSLKAPLNSCNVAGGAAFPTRKTIGIQTDTEVGTPAEEEDAAPVRRSTRIARKATSNSNCKRNSVENTIAQEEHEETEEVQPLILSRRRRIRE